MKKPVFSSSVKGYDLSVGLLDDAKLYLPPAPWEGVDEEDDEEPVYALALLTKDGRLVVDPIQSRLKRSASARDVKAALATIAEEIADQMESGRSAARALLAASWTTLD